MSIPTTPRTPSAFPPPPSITPSTGTAAGDSLLAAQRSRLQELRSSVELGDLPSDVRGAMERSMQVEAVMGLQDINPSFTSAAQTVRIIATPLGMGGTVAEKMLLPAGSKAEVYDSMLLEFAQQWRSGWKFDASGEHDYRFHFPDGMKAFSLLRDNNMPTGQVGVLVRDSCVQAVVQNMVLMGCNVVITEGEHVDNSFNAAIWIPEKRGRKFTPIGAAVAGVCKQIGKNVLVAFDKKNHPGQRALCASFTEEEIRAVNAAGGIVLFGDEKFSLTPWSPPREKGVLFIYADRAQARQAIVDIVVPQLAGFCSLPVSEIEVSMVERSVIARDFGVARIEYPYDIATVDLIYDLLDRRVVRLVHPRLPNSGSFLVKIAGSLDEMQSLLRARLIKPPVVDQPDDEDDEEPILIEPVPTAALSPDLIKNLMILQQAGATMKP